MSTLTLQKVVLGTHPTPANNFLLDTDQAGALRVRRNADGSGGTVLTVESNGRVTLPVNNPGAAPVYGARAWCVFDGTLSGTISPIAGGNIASIVKSAAGSYTVNFTTPMPNANYAVSVNTGSLAGYGGAVFRVAALSKTANSFDLVVVGLNGATQANADSALTNIVVFA